MLAKTATKAIHDMALSNSDSSFLTTCSSKDTTIATVNIGAWRAGADAAFRSDVKEFSCAIHVVSFENLSGSGTFPASSKTERDAWKESSTVLPQPSP